MQDEVRAQGMVGAALRPFRLVLLLFLVAIIVLPWLCRYQPAVAAAPGHTMLVPTQPGPFGGLLKSAQVALEIPSCEYTLLGWGEDEVLYYGDSCLQASDVWSYNPARGKSPRTVAKTPAMLVTREPAFSLLERLYAPGVRPAEVEPNVRALAVRHSPVMVSPDGHWAAFIAQHVYGPQDVLVLRVP